MNPGHIAVLVLVAGFWFPIYWLFGGVFFAVVSLLKNLKLRRVRFSVFFTILCLIMAAGASFAGTFTVREFARQCFVKDTRFVETFARLVGCGIFEYVATGILGFILLLGFGSILLALSRAAHQSWVEHEDPGVEDAREVRFDSF